ncbi:MAG: PhzF family phenazine biosynthesis protein [Desulfobacterales bacterium]|nr:PhzF family phenazine biosynthesis protein [Desulfobacterales bacterium]
MKIYQYDAFSERPNRGNPAGVVLDADHLTETEMQNIAHIVGFNETAFIIPSKKADIQIRYFTPGHEMDLCGHGTVASLIALYEQKGILDINSVETKAGIINARINQQGSNVSVKMQQIPAKFIQFEDSADELAYVLEIEKNEIEDKWPIVYGSTGIWTLIVPIKKLSSINKMSPKTEEFPKVLSQIPRSSIHPFCLETYNQNVHMHGRHFSSPFSGTIEDPVTGTASGVMGAYHINNIEKVNTNALFIEQGQEIGRDGFVKVNVVKTNDIIEVEIEGKGVFVKEITV